MKLKSPEINFALDSQFLMVKMVKYQGLIIAHSESTGPKKIKMVTSERSKARYLHNFIFNLKVDIKIKNTWLYF